MEKQMDGWMGNRAVHRKHGIALVKLHRSNRQHYLKINCSRQKNTANRDTTQAYNTEVKTSCIYTQKWYKTE